MVNERDQRIQKAGRSSPQSPRSSPASSVRTDNKRGISTHRHFSLLRGFVDRPPRSFRSRLAFCRKSIPSSSSMRNSCCTSVCCTICSAKLVEYPCVFELQGWERSEDVRGGGGGVYPICAHLAAGAVGAGLAGFLSQMRTVVPAIRLSTDAPCASIELQLAPQMSDPSLLTSNPSLNTPL